MEVEHAHRGLIGPLSWWAELSNLSHGLMQTSGACRKPFSDADGKLASVVPTKPRHDHASVLYSTLQYMSGLVKCINSITGRVTVDSEGLPQFQSSSSFGI